MKKTVTFRTDVVAFMSGIYGRLGAIYLWTGTPRSTCAVMSSFRMRGIVSGSFYYYPHHELQFVLRAQQVHEWTASGHNGCPNSQKRQIFKHDCVLTTYCRTYSVLNMLNCWRYQVSS